jgi:aminopeptidase-like protein
LNSDSDPQAGERMYSLAKDLWRFPRSITGNGLRATLNRLKSKLPELQIHEIPSGTRVGDWTIPDEWNLQRARLWDPSGQVVCDTEWNNLHIVGYSEPFSGVVTLEELQTHLHSLPGQPDAIPYVTSYYERRWGFCLADEVRRNLLPGMYRVEIDSTLHPGSLTYADLKLPGSTAHEILVSTYVCHPSMANNELSGPVVAVELAQYLSTLADRRYSYRFVFAPETIGAVAYIHKNLDELKRHVIAAFNLTCVGDDRTYSLLPTRAGDRAIDQIARHVLRHFATSYHEYPWESRGSDERQYSAPLVDIPMVSIMRSKYWEYPEYHTSLDNLERVVSPSGLQGGFEATRRAIEIIERDSRPKSMVIGEPMLSRRGLYSSLGAGRFSSTPQHLLDVWSYCDGTLSTLEIADKLQRRFDEVDQLIQQLKTLEIISLTPNYLR